MIRDLKKNIIVFISFLILSFFVGYGKGVFDLDWWTNFDMDIFILSNSISILLNDSQSFYDHPGLIPILLFSIYLFLIDFFNVLGFELVNFYNEINLINYIEQIIFHLRLFNIFSIGILLFTFYKLFDYYFKNLFFSILITISLFINLDFLSFNFSPVRTEIISLIFLNFLFLFSLYFKIDRINLIILGLFLGLALFSKIQTILLFFIYILLFRFNNFTKKKKSTSYFNYNHIILGFIFSIIIYFFNKSIIDTFIYFLLFSFFNFYFYDYKKFNYFIKKIFFFYFGFILIFIFIYINYEYRNIDVVLNPIQNSLRWAQEKYGLSAHTQLEKFKNTNIFDVLKGYRNYIVIIFANIFLILRNKKFENKIISNLILFTILVIFILFSIRSGFLRYGIYTIPLFYLLFSCLLTFEKIKFKRKMLLSFLIINIILNFSFINTKYKSQNNLSNINQIYKSCYNLNDQKEYNYLNYFFSANKKELKIICSSLKTFLKNS